MQKSDITPIIDVDSYPHMWDYNYPVKMYRNNETNEVTYVVFMPRKESCFDGDEPLAEEDVKQVCENMINVLKSAIFLYEKFRDGEIDEISYWDLDFWNYLQDKKEKENGRNTEDGAQDKAPGTEEEDDSTCPQCPLS